MNKQEFFEAVGRWPENDDLERANCKLAGQLGHYGCGVCKHGTPTFECPECWAANQDKGDPL